MQMKYLGILVFSVLSTSCSQQYVPDNTVNSPATTSTSGEPSVLIYDPITGKTKPRDETTPSTDSTSSEISSTYTIKKGDTVYSIGRAYGIAPADIIAWNSLTPPYALSVGQTLTLQGIPSDAPKPSVNLTPPSKSGMLSHTVKKGDTVYSIAKRHGRTPQEIMAWNGLNSPNTLQHGQELNVAPLKTTTKSTTKKNSVSVSTAEHTVGANETLYSIAKRYGQDVDEVATLNGLSKPYTLTVGQTLQVKASGSKPKKTKTLERKPKPSTSVKTVETKEPKTSEVAETVSDPKPTKTSTKTKTPEKTSSGSGGFEIVRHKVVAGDSLESIAQKHGQKVEDVGLWNGIAPPYAVQEGQTILIYK
jgi:LysM repeat protein